MIAFSILRKKVAGIDSKKFRVEHLKVIWNVFNEPLIKNLIVLRDVFNTLSNIYDTTFLQKQLTAYSCNCSHKHTPPKMFGRVLNTFYQFFLYVLVCSNCSHHFHDIPLWAFMVPFRKNNARKGNNKCKNFWI